MFQPVVSIVLIWFNVTPLCWWTGKFLCEIQGTNWVKMGCGNEGTTALSTALIFEVDFSSELFFFFNFALPRKKKPEYSYKFHTTMPPSHLRAWYTQGRLRYTRIILCGNWVPGRPTVLFPWQLSVLWTLTSKALHCFRWPISLTHSYRRGLNRAESSWLGSHCISDLGWEQMGKEEHFMLVKSFKPVLSCELTFFFF